MKYQPARTLLLFGALLGAGGLISLVGTRAHTGLSTLQAPALSTLEAVTLKAERRGFPLMNLRNGKQLGTRFVSAEARAQAFDAASAQSLSMTSADLNADGAADLLVGYAGGAGGHLAYYRGSLDTLSARTPEIFEGMKEGRFPAPFLPEARLIQLPIAPHFVGTGDFNRDGWQDIVAAQRGDNRAFLLAGNGKGGFKQSAVALPGQVTGLLAGKIDPLDNAADVAFAIDGERGAALLIYNGATDAFGAEPEIYLLPVVATSLAIGQLDDDDPLDILAAGSGSAAIIHGVYPDKAGYEGEAMIARYGQVEILKPGFNVVAGRVGNFIWDREHRPEIALLGSDGSVRIFERGRLDKRPFTTAELKARLLKRREEAAAQEAARQLAYQPRRTRIALQKWTEADRLQIAAPLRVEGAAASTSFFTSARMTSLGVEDLLVLDAASRKLHVLLSNNDELKKTGHAFALSASSERAAVTLDVEDTPVAVLPMRLSVMNRPGLVLLGKGSNALSYALAAPFATFTVTKTADTYDGTCNADCSFREALQAANAGSSSDMIMVPAGTYTINPALGGPDQDTTIDPAAQQSGDWDVFYDSTIVGADQATTILQAGASTATGHDRVLDAIQTGVGIPDLTISGVTIRHGRCQAGCVDGGGLRYAVDNQSVLTISDSTITSNRTEVNTASPANNGGGIYGGQSDFVYTNLTVTNNTAGFVTGSIHSRYLKGVFLP